MAVLQKQDLNLHGSRVRQILLFIPTFHLKKVSQLRLREVKLPVQGHTVVEAET